MTNLDIQKAYLGLEQVDKVYLGSEQVYPTGPTGYASMYLTVEIISASTATNTKRFPISNSGLSYSVNDGPWTQAPSTATTNNPLLLTVYPGDIIRFKGIGAGKSAFQYSSQNIPLYDVYGNILSLEYGDNFVGQTGFTTNYRPFYSAFRNNGYRGSSIGGVRSAEHLVLPPIVVEDCYRSCFHGNHLMEVGPELPAKTPAVGCYFFMFGDCFSLTSSPVIQLESLASGSCYQMFQYCSGLTEITCLAQSGINQYDSTTNWVQEVASTGTFYKHPNATWPSGNNGVPNRWTVQDYVEPNP